MFFRNKVVDDFGSEKQSAYGGYQGCSTLYTTDRRG
jgi:hypothetical protein